MLDFWRGQLERIDVALRAVAPEQLKALDWEALPGWIRRALGLSFWTAEDAALIAVVLPYLSRGGEAAIDYHAALLRDIPLSAGVDWSSLHDDVASWAREHAGALCRATVFNPKTGKYEFTPDRNTINANTRRAIGERVASWFETPGATLGDLMGELSQLRAFGPLAPEVPGKQTRAQLVATSEITGAAAVGNRISADRLVKQLGPLGVMAIDQWHTNADDRVCAVCRPLHGKRVEHGASFGQHQTTGVEIRTPMYDTHPGCYCWVTTRYEVQ